MHNGGFSWRREGGVVDPQFMVRTYNIRFSQISYFLKKRQFASSNLFVTVKIVQLNKLAVDSGSSCFEMNGNGKNQSIYY